MKTDFLEKHNGFCHAEYVIVFLIKNLDY